MELRELPSVDELLRTDRAAGGSRAMARSPRRARRWPARARRSRPGRARATSSSARSQRPAPRRQPRLRRVINATGVVLHTNLGRAPLAPAALDAVGEVARGYSNLEYDLDDGRARRRATTTSRALLRELTGAEDALVVNNNAAARAARARRARRRAAR